LSWIEDIEELGVEEEESVVVEKDEEEKADLQIEKLFRPKIGLLVMAGLDVRLMIILDSCIRDSRSVMMVNEEERGRLLQFFLSLADVCFFFVSKAHG